MDYEPMTPFTDAKRVLHRVEPDPVDPANPPKTEEEVLADLARDECVAGIVGRVEASLIPPT